jgi:hypothetical protein
MPKIKVALRGVDPRAADRFRNLFLINYHGKCVLADQAEADITLVDIEGMGAALPVLLQTLDASRTVMLSESGTGPDGFRVLQKPARLNLLWDAIASARTGDTAVPVADQPVAHGPAAALADRNRVNMAVREQVPVQVRKLGNEAYDPADYFIGVIQGALGKSGAHRAVQLTTWNLSRIVIHPATDTFYSDLSRNQFRALAATPLAKNLRDLIKVEYLPGLPSRDELDGMHRSSGAHILWEMAYATSRGRLPVGVALEDRQSLSRWPNFTRLPAVSNGMRIAAVWAGQPQRLDDIAARLAISPDEVYAFYAGAAALGLVGGADQHGVAVEEARQHKTTASRSLLGSLLGHLGSAFRPRAGSEKGDWPLGEQA